MLLLFVGDDWLILRDVPPPVFIMANFSVEYSVVFICIDWPLTIKFEFTIKSPLIVASPV